jgi:glycoprotein endo-alpha-1,2-mannosidase
VWAIYIGSFGHPAFDGRWIRWQKKSGRDFWERNEPPAKVALDQYPQLGLYSSHDPSVLRAHMRQMRDAGIDGLVLQWWSTNSSDRFEDDAAGFSDATLSMLLAHAEEASMRVAVHIQPYESRTNSSVYDDVKYLFAKHAAHPAWIRVQDRPVVLVYEPFSVPNIYTAVDRLRAEGLNPFLIGSIVEHSHIAALLETGFDGFFSFFPSDGFTYGSNTTHWANITKDALERGILFTPTVGPGFDDKCRTYFKNNPLRNRTSGGYYAKMFDAAIATRAPIITINSWNNFHDQSHIEPVVERFGNKYSDQTWALNGDPDTYLRLTKQLIHKFKSS